MLVCQRLACHRRKAPRCPDDIVVADAGERAYTSESQMGWAAEIENMVRKGGDADSGMI